MEYTTIDDVKRLLRILNVPGDNQHKIRFSDSYTVPEAYTNNTGTAILDGKLVINPAYAGSEFWHVEFISPTQFSLFRSEDTTKNDGTGSKTTSFLSLSKIVRIPVEAWVGGEPAAGDKFKFRTDSNMSDDDVAGYIDDSGAIVDVMLREKISDTYVPFSNKSLPVVISKATAYIAANLVYTSIYASMSVDTLPTLVRRWYNLGRDMIKFYMESIDGKNKNAFTRHARFISRQPLFTKISVAEAAGIEGMVGEIETVNVEYDTDFNNREQLGST